MYALNVPKMLKVALCAIMNGFHVYDDVCGLYCAYVLNVLEVSLKRHDA